MGNFWIIQSCLILFSTISCITGDDVFVQVNLKRQVNVVSDKYVSFSIDPKVLLENFNSTNGAISDIMAKQLQPSYLKISGNSFFKLLSALSQDDLVVELNDQVPQNVWMNFNKWIRSVDWMPIVPLPYNPMKWDSINALRILNISSALGIKDCIWQLGLDFDAIGAPRYVDDLTTLKNIVEAFKGFTNNWGIVGADISAGSNRDETGLYIDLAQDLIQAIGWIQPQEYATYENQNNIVHDRDLALRAILSRNLPAWLNLPQRIVKNKSVENCSTLCVTEGLQWAQTLGDAARAGFNVVFRPLDKSDITDPGFSFYVSLLFKKTMGEKVFDTKMINGDRYISHFYSHCSKNLSGAVTIMGINMGETRSKILTKISHRYTGPELWQYILTVNDGTVQLNGQTVQLNSTYEPLVKIKHPSKALSLILPPLSIGFWILPSANLKECYKEDSTDVSDPAYNEEFNRAQQMMTSSDLLLQQLIKENIAPISVPVSNRLRRHIVVKKDSKYLNQQFKELDRNAFHHYAKPSELVRHKRFILKNNNRPRFFQNLFDMQGPAAPAAPPPPPPAPVETSITEDNRRFKRVFPKFPRLEKFFNRKIRRVRRQTGNLFKMRPFAGQPKLFPRLPPIVQARAQFRRQNQEQQQHQKPQPNEEVLLAPRKDIQFPEGDIHVNLTKFPDADYDYVEFESNADKTKSSDAPDNQAFQNVPNAFHETLTISKIIPRVEQSVVLPSQPEMNLPNNPFVGHELEPTLDANNLQLRNAQAQLKSYYMPTERSTQSVESDEDILHPKTSRDASDEILPYKFTGNVNSRKRRNAVVKSLSWALSQENNNQISKDSDLDSASVFNRVIPHLRLRDFDRTARPRSLDELKAHPIDEKLNYDTVGASSNPSEIGEETKGVAKIRIIAEGNSADPESPKFMKYLTTRLNTFMDMVNHHVTGWWNTWV